MNGHLSGYCTCRCEETPQYPLCDKCRVGHRVVIDDRERCTNPKCDYSYDLSHLKNIPPMKSGELGIIPGNEVSRWLADALKASLKARGL